MILYLAHLFGARVNVNASVNSHGDLVIVGSNKLEQEYFNFTIKAEVNQDDDASDSDESAILDLSMVSANDLTRSTEDLDTPLTA